MNWHANGCCSQAKNHIVSIRWTKTDVRLLIPIQFDSIPFENSTGMKTITFLFQFSMKWFFFCSSDSMGTTSHMNFCFILVNSCISNIIQCISNGSKPNYTHSSVQVFDQNIISLHCHREHHQLIETNYQLINKTVDVPMALTISFCALLLFAFFSSFP